MVTLEKTVKSKDHISTKFKFNLDNKYVIELLLVERKEKNIICFPCQIGCSLSCKFCKSGIFMRDLTPNEIYTSIEQVKNKIRVDRKPLLLSCMGIGEPSLNKNILDIFDKIYGLGDKLAVATTGIRSQIFSELNQFEKRLKVMLSLHAVTTEKRAQLLCNYMDVNYLMNEFNKYRGSKEINYVLLKNFNDTMKDCRALKKLSDGIPVKINRYNKTNDHLNASDKIKRFMFVYKLLGGKIEYYETDGVDIEGACGMMTYQIK